MNDVFISYSRKDTDIADRICKAFDDVNIKYFIDRHGIGGGAEFPDELADAIINSSVFLLLGSSNSYDSPFTKREVTFAFNKKKGERMLPYLIDNTPLPSGLELVFSSINWRNIKDHPIETELVDDIFRMLGRTRTIPKSIKVDIKPKKIEQVPIPHSKHNYMRYAVIFGVMISVIQCCLWIKDSIVISDLYVKDQLVEVYDSTNQIEIVLDKMPKSEDMSKEQSEIGQSDSSTMKLVEIKQKNQVLTDYDQLYKKAKTISDFKFLADKQYAKAYAPLAKLYLQDHMYEEAEIYACKAVEANVGQEQAIDIIEMLRSYGYYATKDKEIPDFY